MVLGAGTCGSTARASSAGVTTARGQLALAGTGLGSELYSRAGRFCHLGIAGNSDVDRVRETDEYAIDRKSTRLNSSHVAISYAVFCLKKKRAGSGEEGGDVCAAA